MKNKKAVRRSFFKYLFYGVLFVAVQTFWVSVIWGKDRSGYLLEVGIVDVTFVTATFIIGWIFSRLRLAELLLYLLSGVLGLVVIEWIIAGHIPGTTQANQFVMFTTWAGTALFAWMQTDRADYVARVQKFTFRIFILFAVIVTGLGIFFMGENPKLAFAITYLAANIGYPLFIVFFLWYVVVKLRGPKVAG